MLDPAGVPAFMDNLAIGGHRVTGIRPSGAGIAGIAGIITSLPAVTGMAAPSAAPS